MPDPITEQAIREMQNAPPVVHTQQIQLNVADVINMVSCGILTPEQAFRFIFPRPDKPFKLMYLGVKDPEEPLICT